MPEYVHVKDNETGHEYPITVARYERDPDYWTKTGKPALGPDRFPVPVKHKTTVDKSAAAKSKSGQKADSTEGSN